MDYVARAGRSPGPLGPLLNLDIHSTVASTVSRPHCTRRARPKSHRRQPENSQTYLSHHFRSSRSIDRANERSSGLVIESRTQKSQASNFRARSSVPSAEGNASVCARLRDPVGRTPRELGSSRSRRSAGPCADAPRHASPRLASARELDGAPTAGA